MQSYDLRLLLDNYMEENDQILISWIDEYVYCPRRFYLKVLEKYDSVNVYMVEGTIGHRNVDKPRIEKRHDYVKVFSHEVYSKKLRLYGKCDSIEFVKSYNGVYIPLLNGCFSLTPIEFKHGHIRNEKEYNLQLTAQAICLEEMYGCKIEKGYIYYLDSKERYEVEFDEKKRLAVTEYINKIRDLLESPKLIEPLYKKRCAKCSVYDICDPKNNIVNKYMSELRDRYYAKS